MKKAFKLLLDILWLGPSILIHNIKELQKGELTNE